jgi:kynurenine formamidase
MTASTQAARQGQIGNWGRWGATDERGAANLLTPDVVRAATQVCRTGTVYELGLPVRKEGTPLLSYRPAPQRWTTQNSSDKGMYDDFGGPGVTANEDVLVLASHNETHMDALCHVGFEDQLYNGFPAESVKTASGAAHCGIDKLGPLVGRAVLLDLPAYFGTEMVEGGYAITSEDLSGCADRQGVELRSGDILLVRTGWVDAYLNAPSESMFWPQPGLGVDACSLIADRDIAVVGSDNSAIEVMPFDGGRFLAVHIELLVRLGVPLIEHLVLSALARDQVYESLFIAAPLPVTGATGSPLNPVAIG